MFKSFFTHLETISIQHPELKYLFALLVILYIGTILYRAVRILKLVSCITALGDFIESKNSFTNFSNKSERTSAEYKALRKYPLIREFKSIYSDGLSYSHSSYTNYENAISLYNQFLMIRNDFAYELRKSINPFSAVKQLFLLPGSLIRFIGFEPKDIVTKTINILVWTVTFILNLYGAEIKLFIDDLLK